MALNEKMRRLKSIVANCESVVVAFSGGVDSSLVCAVAREILGDRAIAVTAVSPTYPPDELEVAKSVAKFIGIGHQIIATDELRNPNFVANPAERCYFCKSELYRKLDGIRRELGFKKILDGTNYDDLSDFRPGLRAAEEFKVVSPLALAELTKAEVRELASAYGLPNADKPANPCLASRIPFGCAITAEKLERIAGGERFLRSLGFKIVRLRDHGDFAKIEVGEDELPKALELKDAIVEELKKLGYSHIALDLEGYRPGSLTKTKKV